MYTFQDLSILQSERAKMDFIIAAIHEHEGSPLYRTAQDAEDYYKHRNPTIMKAQKLIYNMMGRAVPDIYSANNKVPSNYYHYFVTQECQYLLGNGISFNNIDKNEKLGKNFDYAVQQIALKALNGSVAFGFWNVDHLEVFGISKGGSNGNDAAFVPLYDEETGALRAGIRYWQIATNKPLRATLFEEDGYTEYIKRKDGSMNILAPKRAYKLNVITSTIDGTQITSGENYPTLPIVPLYNVNKQSEIIGGRETLDAYDLMASTLINNIDDGNLIYWVLKNCGGMDDIDDAKFIERLKTTHVAHADGDDGAQIEAHSVNVAYEASETALNRLRSQLFDDFMALDVKNISSGASTATEIRAAYEPLNSKVDMFEFQVTEFIFGILKLAGLDDYPSYTRSVIVNRNEEIQNVLQSANYLDSEYITRKILDIVGDTDKAESVLERLQAEETKRFAPDGEAD